ncbi:dispanin subfamily A member 2b isoform X2 [Oreochromis niloticus]|uniref:dispanin subfamily A member 2b isoform X2 n=1 Tax=Oreochromis niloticus TaxID=8128 RepID=UPI000DF14E55|nr:dispanin subfamily A member 2b-like isoform X2 [Oreochromis niloticus]
MDPQDYPTEAVPLQGVSYGELPIQPTVIQQTAVNINTDKPVIIEYPQDHIMWSICCFVYANPFCLGLVALLYSIKARDRKVAGDVDGARRYGSTARNLNIAATIIAAIGFLIFIITFTVIRVQTASYSSYSYNHQY